MNRGDGPGRPESHITDPGKEARSAAHFPVVPAFDGFRALAILGVVLLHVSGASGVLARSDGGVIAVLISGTVGHAIDILFIVSGFVVFLPTVARAGQFGKVVPYGIRRAARLFPAYWMILLISFLVIVVVPGDPPVAVPGLSDITFNFLGLETAAGMLISGIRTGFDINPPVWTLSVEIAFYLVLPLIAGWYFRRPLLGLGIAALISVGWSYAFTHIGDIPQALLLNPEPAEQLRLLLASEQQLPSWAFSFALGMTGVWVFVKHRNGELPEMAVRAIKPLMAVAFAGLLFFVWRAGSFAEGTLMDGTANLSRHSIDVNLGYSLCLATLMVTIALVPGWWQKPFTLPAIRRLGDISYGVYLSHMVFVYLAVELVDMPASGTVGAFLLWSITVIPASILYGYLSARFLEQPIRRWARRFGSRSSAEPGAKTV